MIFMRFMSGNLRNLVKNSGGILQPIPHKGELIQIIFVDTDAEKGISDAYHVPSSWEIASMAVTLSILLVSRAALQR